MVNERHPIADVCFECLASGQDEPLVLTPEFTAKLETALQPILPTDQLLPAVMTLVEVAMFLRAQSSPTAADSILVTTAHLANPELRQRFAGNPTVAGLFKQAVQHQKVTGGRELASAQAGQLSGVGPATTPAGQGFSARSAPPVFEAPKKKV